MPTHGDVERCPVFISHATEDLAIAQEAEAVLEASGFDPWLDRSDIRFGALLGRQLTRGIQASRAVVLLWSSAAAGSRWVASEVLQSFHAGRFIVPCVLDDAPLPQFLSRSVYLDLRRGSAEALEQLAEKLREVPGGRNDFHAIRSYRSGDLGAVIDAIRSRQVEILSCLPEDLPGARHRQAELDPIMGAAEERWRYDPGILNLAGYHRKNAYMLSHWDEYCAGRFPADPVLGEAERLFLETLFVNPVDYNALNGLGNVLLFEGELDAAELFVRSAIDCAAERGLDFVEARNDLAVIQSRTGSP
jgi:hypothetical protein